MGAQGATGNPQQSVSGVVLLLLMIKHACGVALFSLFRSQARGLPFGLWGGGAAGDSGGALGQHVPAAPLALRGLRGASASRETPDSPGGKLREGSQALHQWCASTFLFLVEGGEGGAAQKTLEVREDGLHADIWTA